MSHRLGFAGDVMLGRGVDVAQRRRPTDAVWGDLHRRLRRLDGLFVNLECCLSRRGTPAEGRRFHFRADPEWAVEALERAGVDWCALANNHALDFGPEALADTLDALDGAGIAHAGAGQTEASARAPALVSAGGVEVAVVSFTDNTPAYAAGPATPGTARVEFDLDDAESRRTVAATLDEARALDPDLVTASLHWGPNMETDPPEAFRAFGRWLVDRGVDLVHGHSAHVVQGVEVHDGRPILYDCGDFVDDYAVDPDLRNDRSFLFTLRIEGGEPASLDLDPVEIRDYAVHEASPDAAAWLREWMRERSEPLGTRFERAEEGLSLQL